MNRKPVSSFGMQFVTSTLSITLVLLLLGLVALFVLTANNLSIFVRENIAFAIELDDSMKEPEILQFQKAIERRPYVKEAVYISKQQAEKEQAEAMGTDPSEFLKYNPYNASIEIKLNAGYANADSIRWIKEELQAHEGVTGVDYPQELIDSVNLNIRKISLVLLGLAALLALISFALINNTIRLSLYAKRFLIHTMKLVGASGAFIRRPFLVHNLWIGVLAAAIANALLMGLVYLLATYEPDLLQVVTPEVMLIVIGVVFACGIIITTLCAWISINKFLRFKAHELYSI